jgi:hypothetical protein
MKRVGNEDACIFPLVTLLVTVFCLIAKEVEDTCNHFRLLYLPWWADDALTSYRRITKVAQGVKKLSNHRL